MLLFSALFCVFLQNQPQKAKVLAIKTVKNAI